MFKGMGSNSGTKKNGDFTVGKINQIQEGTEIKGSINTEADLRIDGKVVGTINSRAKVILGQNSVIEGDINCLEADILGSVTGNVYVDELLQLKQTAKVNGDIFSKKLVVEVGAEFNGKCQMGQKPKNLSSIKVSENGKREEKKPGKEESKQTVY